MPEEVEKKKKKEIETENYVCPGCGGIMKFNAEKGKFLCSSCGNEEQIQTIVDNIKEYDFKDYLNREAKCTPFEGFAAAGCQNCGSEIVFEEFKTATVCPMCGSTQIATIKQKAGIPPEGIIPFKVSKPQANELFQKWIRQQWFAPNKLKHSFQEGNLMGEYIPFWTYDADVVSSYVGNGGITRTVTDSEGNSKTVTDWYPVSGVVRNFFDDVQICASKNSGVQIINKILPYNTIDGLSPYSPAYLSGYQAELYSIKANEAFNYAKKEMENHMTELAHREILSRFNQAHVTYINSKYSNVTYKHVLLPAWCSAYFYGGKTYRYIINGETGRVSGERPYSVPKIVAAVIAVLLLAFAIYYFTEDTEGAQAYTYQEQNSYEAQHYSNEILVEHKFIMF